jgi:hypothetical protein
LGGAGGYKDFAPDGAANRHAESTATRLAEAGGDDIAYTGAKMNSTQQRKLKAET